MHKCYHRCKLSIKCGTLWIRSCWKKFLSYLLLKNLTIVVFLGGIGLDWELSQHTRIHMTADNISLFHCHGTKSHHFHCYKNERKIVPFSMNRESTIKINTEQYIMNLLYTHSNRQTRKFSLGYTEPLCNQAIFSSSNTLFWWEIFGEKERKYLSVWY